MEPHPNSRFWIHGNATIRTFTCAVTKVGGQARLPAPRDTLAKEVDAEQTTVVVRVPVRAVDCGNSRMTRDLQEALKMKQHPEIHFELVHATVGARTDTSAQWRRVEALGPLTIAGTKRLIRLQAAARAYDDEHFRLRGC
ncbi:MAG: YceI family protein, partial [Salinibacter sp.]